jgi:hypothetical protein
MLYQIGRVNNKEIVGSTVQNYLKSVKLFCEMADINIHWKKITRGFQREKVMRTIEFQQTMKFNDYWAILTEESKPLYTQ